VVDVALPGPGQDPVRAWLVAGEPIEGDDTGRPRAAVLWLHWLGHRHNDRGEFLPLAVELAARGVVSLLPAGHFPWVPDPDGTARDVQRVHDQVRAHAIALDHLCAQPGVDPARVAVVGHDYGGMYGALLADQDERVSALALQAVDSGWANWFSTYWLKLEGDARVDYGMRFAPVEPIVSVARSAPRLRDGVLFQWAGNDTFVGPDVPNAYASANPLARAIDYAGADHMLDDHAARDLVGFLEERLGLDRN
jgi:dienelactone hydrolase